MAIAISRALHERLLALAAADPDREVCGLLFGAPDRIEAIQPCANVSPNPEDSFEIDPAALIAAHKAERGGGATIIGCYHSHPDGSAEPSARDVEGMDAGLAVWAIVGGGRVAGWTLDGGCLATEISG